MKKSTAITQLTLISAIVVVILLISTKFYFRLDFTDDERYTLSRSTKDILTELNEVITIKAYFTKELPPQLLSVREEFENLLKEYEDRSNGNIVYEFINPNEKQELEQVAQQQGISPVIVNVREKDQSKQLRAYLGVTLQQGEKSEVIPMVRPNTSMEYELTTSIKKLSVAEKPKVAFIQGHGEPPLNASVQLNQQLSVLYDTENYSITDTAEIPAFYKAVIIFDPLDTIPQSHFDKLDRYLAQGGSALISYNNLSSDLQARYLQAKNNIGMKDWLSNKGITLNETYVVDANCGSVQVQQRMGPISMPVNIQLPFLPLISTFADHPIVEGLESVYLPFSASISYMPQDSAIRIEPLLFSSDMSGTVDVPATVRIDKEWQESDFTDPGQVLAVAASGPLAGGQDAKLVFVSNTDFAVNGMGQQQQGRNEDNINFASNAVDWLADDTGLVNLRTKGVTNRPLEQLEDSKRTTIKWLNTLLPVMLILFIGLMRRQRYRRKKQRWIQGNY